jgi:hypothetical protein
MSPASPYFAQHFVSNFLEAVSFLQDVFQCLAEPSSLGASHALNVNSDAFLGVRYFIRAKPL